MFAPRITASRETRPVEIAGYLQLAGLLIIAIAAREIESSAGPVGDHPLMILAVLVGAATFAGATALRRSWNHAIGPPADATDEPADAPAPAPALARERTGPAEPDFAPAPDFAPVEGEAWRWRSGAGIGATDPRRPVLQEIEQGARVGAPR